MSEKEVLLHLGCGRRYIPGFIHIDLDKHSHIDYQSAIDDLNMFNDQSVDLIYSSHALEYFDRTEVNSVLQEWRRVLKPGGILRIAVPDFDALLQVYKKSGDLNKILGPLFGRIEISSEEEDLVFYHKTVYDFHSLRGVLEENGFKNIRRYDWQKTIHKDHDDHSQAYIPHMDKENGLLISLNVEAERV